MKKRLKRILALTLCITFIFANNIFALEEAAVLTTTAPVQSRDAFKQAISKIVVDTFKEEIKNLSPQIIDIIKPYIDDMSSQIESLVMKQKSLSKDLSVPEAAEMDFGDISSQVPNIPQIPSIPTDGQTIPSDIQIPTNIPTGIPTTIPPGVTIPSGITLPPGITIPTSMNTAERYLAFDANAEGAPIKKGPSKEEIQAQVKAEIEASFSSTLSSLESSIKTVMDTIAPKIKDLIKPTIKATIPKINDLIENNIEQKINENIEASIKDLLKLMPEDMKNMTPAQVAEEFKEELRPEIESAVRPIIESEIKSTVMDYVKEKIEGPMEEKLAPKLDTVGTAYLEKRLSAMTPEMESYVPKAFIQGIVNNQISILQSKIPDIVNKQKTSMKTEIDTYVDDEIRNETKIYIGDKRIDSDVKPRIMNDRMMMPFRVIAESLGAEVEWMDATQQVMMTRGDNKVLLTLDSPVIEVNGIKQEMDVAPVIVEDRTMVPVRFVAENLGLDVEWQGDWNMVSLTPIETPPSVPVPTDQLNQSVPSVIPTPTVQ